MLKLNSPKEFLFLSMKIFFYKIHYSKNSDLNEISDNMKLLMNIHLKKVCALIMNLNSFCE
jgi:ferric iron reductase protein FhuF